MDITAIIPYVFDLQCELVFLLCLAVFLTTLMSIRNIVEALGKWLHTPLHQFHPNLSQVSLKQGLKLTHVRKSKTSKICSELLKILGITSRYGVVNSSKKEKDQEYEITRNRKFQISWTVGHQWLERESKLNYNLMYP
jgi:hypothetical protein